ncbi:uncharacterized protein LOC129582849 [Paramacrobiotus metropolitanus]|uniref:uncharacterized protein LOC129582849 n=1 Tax=Paramacrobiotus metropolitanus TaxID=2943436 RepID=UPI00244562D6|nr:uncharacterized protein LOC129582849 [Paramacrobiotus metropolitanus]
MLHHFLTLLIIYELHAARAQDEVYARPWKILGSRDQTLPVFNGTKRSPNDESLSGNSSNGTYITELCSSDRPVIPTADQVSHQPIFMLKDARFREWATIIRKFGLLHVIGYYGIHQMAISGGDLAPEKIEQALTTAWKVPIEAAEAALRSQEYFLRGAEFKIQASILELDKHRWFSQNGDHVARVTYTIVLISTEADVPRTLQRIPLISVDHLAEELRHENITLHVGPIFRAWLADMTNASSVTDKLKELQSVLPNTASMCFYSIINAGAALRDVRTVQIIPGQPFNVTYYSSVSRPTEDAVPHSGFLSGKRIFRRTILPFLIKINGSVLPTSYDPNLRTHAALQTLSEGSYDLEKSETPMQYKLNNPIHFQDLPGIADGIAKAVQSRLEGSSKFVLRKELNNPDLLGDRLFLGCTTAGLSVDGMTVSAQLYAGRMKPGDALFILTMPVDPTLPLYKPLYNAVYGKAIQSSPYPVRVVDPDEAEDDGGLPPMMALPPISNHYPLALIIDEVGEDPEILSSTVLDKVLGLVVAAFNEANPLQLNDNRLNITLTRYEGGKTMNQDM